MTLADKAAQASKVATNTAYASAGGTIVAGLTLNEIAAIIGVIIATASFFVSWYYKSRHLALALELAKKGLNDDEGDD